MGIHHHTLRGYVDSGAVTAFWIGKRPWITAEEITYFGNYGTRVLEKSACVSEAET
jgi:hypothetical protein